MECLTGLSPFARNGEPDVKGSEAVVDRRLPDHGNP
jgi:hypothetical protein